MQLILYTNSNQRRNINIPTDGGTIGRADENTIVLREAGIADRHANFKYINDGWYIIDIDHRGDVSVDGKTGSKLPLYEGSRITIASCSILVTSVEEEDNITTSITYKGPEVVHDLTVTKQCPNCGYLSHEASQFCPSCGYAFNSSIPASPVMHAHSESTITPWLALVFSVCGPIVLGIGWLIGGIIAIFYLSRSRAVV